MFDTLDMHILEILGDDARATPERIAVMTGSDAEAIRRRVARLEEEHVLVKYPALINWEKTERRTVQAVIEVRVQPQRDRGFDTVAARISQFEEVTNVCLMNGGYDLLVTVQAATLQQLASFIASKLSPLESVLGTTTHFILKTYKYGGVVLDAVSADRRLAVTP